MRKRNLLLALFVVFLVALVLGALPATAPADVVPKCCVIMVCPDPPHYIIYGKLYSMGDCQPDPKCTTLICP